VLLRITLKQSYLKTRDDSASAGIGRRGARRRDLTQANHSSAARTFRVAQSRVDRFVAVQAGVRRTVKIPAVFLADSRFDRNTFAVQLNHLISVGSGSRDKLFSVPAAANLQTTAIKFLIACADNFGSDQRDGRLRPIAVNFQETGKAHATLSNKSSTF
jgi:hypothetical protein